MTSLAQPRSGITLSPGGRNWKPAPRQPGPSAEPPATLRLPPGTSFVQRIIEAPEALILSALAQAARKPAAHFHNAHPELGSPVSPRALWFQLSGTFEGASPNVWAAMVARLDALVDRGLAVRGQIAHSGKTRPVYWPAKEAQP